MNRDNHIDIRGILVYFDVFLGYVDVHVVRSIFLLQLILIVFVISLARNKPDCDEVVEDDYDHQIQAEHVKRGQLLLFAYAYASSYYWEDREYQSCKTYVMNWR
jgi:hypothetical protein